MKNDLIKIKKRYGEKMMHMCASLFPTILEYDGLLYNLISSLFAYSKYLCDDIIKNDKEDDFALYILSFFDNKINMVETDKNPFELMDEAGYILYECHNEEDVMKFRKYYTDKERICTFYNNRTFDHYVFFAVKKNVADIKRKDFDNPYREDLYGTSVISIQFRKGKINVLSIKNRYNHMVNNPDATFSNNLENIAHGLTYSFQKKYHLNIIASQNDFELPGYCLGSNGKLYKYNYCINNIYYCANNTIVSGKEVIEYEKEKYLITDYFIIDLVNKTIKLYDSELEDSFIIDKPVNKIIVTNLSLGKKVEIYTDDYSIILELDKYNRIIKYTSNIKEIGDNFLSYNKTLREFNNDYITIIGNDFMPRNDILTRINIPNIIKIGDSFLEQNTKIKEVNFPLLKEVGSIFMRSSSLDEIDFPNLEIVGNSFISFNENISKISMPKLRKVGDFFLNHNRKLKSINLPNLEVIGSQFISNNHDIYEAYLPNLKYIGDKFLQHNRDLFGLDLPNVYEISDDFMYMNSNLEVINLPKVLRVGNNFLASNEYLKKLIAPNILLIGEGFLENNYYFNKTKTNGLKKKLVKMK